MKNELKFIGEVVGIRPLQVFTSKNDASKTYKKQEIIVEEHDEQYPNSILLEAFGDKIEKLDNIKMGDIVEVVYNVKARTWEKEGKSGVMCANSIWKITVTTVAPFVSAATPHPTDAIPPQIDGKDDLPF